MQYVGRALIETAKGKAASEVTQADVREAFATFGKLARSTQHARATLMRRLLKDLRDDHGIPRLWQAVPRIKNAPPRDVTVTPEELRRLLAGAEPYLELFILLCSTLAIRSGTAARLGPQHYDRVRQTLTYTTKYDARQHQEVSARIAALIAMCDPTDNATPFVAQLHKRGAVHTHNLRAAFRRLCKRQGINRRIIPHDLRRTTAVQIYSITKDMRQVQAALGHSNMQSTVHYLDHRATVINRDMYELVQTLNTQETIQ